jgi:hypothetical protein
MGDDSGDIFIIITINLSESPQSALITVIITKCRDYDSSVGNMQILKMMG